MTNLGLEVPLSSISRELKKLWDDDSSRTNASLMNFAVFTEDRAKLEENSKSISWLTREHACRALSIALDRNGEGESIQSWITAHCNMVNGKKTVCCEQISFLLNGYVQGRMRNTVFANLNSDLPLVFWWQGELTDVFEPKLYTLIDRFIYDSAEWTSPLACYEKVLTAASEAKRRFVMQDLAWTRTYAVRLAFAALFDEPVANDALKDINKIQLKAITGYETSALLLLSWLGTQAGWSFITATPQEVKFRTSAGTEIVANLEYEADASVPILELSLASETVCISVNYDLDNRLFTQSITSPTVTFEHATPAPEIRTIDLVEDQLSRGGKNSLLKKTLPLFLELLKGS